MLITGTLILDKAGPNHEMALPTRTVVAMHTRVRWFTKQTTGHRFYRDRLFTLNFHGRRANQEILSRNGSGYVASHGQDLLLAKDPWFRGMELGSGPDGAVFCVGLE